MSSDRRRSFRCGVQPELRSARLVVRGERVPAEIVEQSCGGYRVSVAAGLKFAANELVELETWAGTCEALVAYVEDHGDCRHLGLQRTTDVLPRRRGWFGLLWRRSRTTRTGRGLWARRALLIGGGLTSVAVGSNWLLHYLADDAPQPVAVASAGGQQPSAITGASPAATAAPDAAQDPLATLDRLVALQKKDVVARLELSEHQKLQISRLLADTSRSLNRLQSRRAAKTPLERKQRIAALLTRADERALQILTPAQRSQWRGGSLMPGAPATPSTVVASSAGG